jgi:hypothetical protein
MVGRSCFGTELRARRQAAGYSLGQFATLIHYSKGYLSKVESGDKPGNTALARQCDAQLDAHGELLALATDQDTTRADAPDPAGLDTVSATGSWTMRMGADGTGSFTLLPDDDAAPTDVFASGLGFASDRSPVDPDAVAAHFGLRFDLARTLGQQMSPLTMLPVLIAETHMLRGLAARTAPGEAAPLWRMAARYAEFVGWMVQEAGNQQAALWWTVAAVRMSDLTGDADLRPYALVRRAELTLHEDDGRQTIDLALRALADPSASARVRALASHRVAQGYALLGDAQECVRALDRSAGLMAEAGSDQGATTALGSINTPDMTSMITGWCLFDLGRPAEAATLLEAGLLGFAAASSRAKSRYGVRTALAQAGAGEVERACEILGLLATELGQIDSETVRHDLRLLHRELRRRSTAPGVRDLLPLFGELLRGPEAHRA